MSEIVPGLSASIQHTVREQDTAIELGSGDLPVLATPRLVAWLEGAAVAALDGKLEATATTVGGHIAVDHLAPTLVGNVVVASATVTGGAGRRIEFEVEAAEGGTTIARGRHVRFVVDRERFMSR